MKLTAQKHQSKKQSAFTLLELILSLALTVVITALIGGLIQLYLTNRDTGRESVRQAQLARAILNMISEDVRTTIRYQSFDVSGLQQLLTSGSGGGGGGGASGSAGAAGGGAAGGGSGGGGSGGGSSGGSPSSGGGMSGGSAPSGGSPSGGSPGGSSGGAANAAGGGGTGGGSGADATSSGSSTQATLPPGIYGSSTSIEIDVSRLPRPDEYIPRIGNASTGSMGDMPSDVKTVGYYVQAPRSDGVQDSLGQLQQESLQSNGATTAVNGGLIRRSVDRAVTQYAYEIAQSDQLLRTGELIAPEVLAIEFQYFDGATWQTQWDGSTQGLPHVVKITIAMQRESFSRSKPIDPGISISTISTSMMQEYGIEIYSTNTIIPGAQLLVAPQGTTGTDSTDTGMSSMGL